MSADDLNKQSYSISLMMCLDFTTSVKFLILSVFLNENTVLILPCILQPSFCIIYRNLDNFVP